MNSKWCMTVLCASLGVVIAMAPAQERVIEVSATELATLMPLEYDGVAAVSTAKMMNYQGYAEKAGAALNNTSMVVELRAFPTAVGGVQQGVTVTRTLLPSEVYKGSFSFDFDAALLALPDNADESYLEVAVCSPDPCSAVPLAPRRLITHAALAASARNLGDAARPGPNGSLEVASSAAASGEMSLKNQSATAMMSFKAANSEIAASQAAGAAPLKLASTNIADNSQTYMRLDDAAKAVEFGAEDAALETAGITPPTKLRLSLEPAAMSMSATNGASPASYDFKYGGESAMRIGEDPEAFGQAVMMVGPKGLLLTETPLASESNVAAPPSNYVRLRMITAAQGESAQSGAAALLGSKLQVEGVSGGVPTPLMEIDATTSAAKFYGAEGVSATRVRMDSTLASNVAGPGASAELSVNSTTGDVELKVGTEIVDRWTQIGFTGSGLSPNRISGSSSNLVSPGIFGAVIGGGFDNTVSAYDATIDGGYSNTASGYVSTVGGGSFNTASWDGATVSGGNNNVSSSYMSTVGGGHNNTASGVGSAVGGGRANIASQSDATVGGGTGNTASGSSSTIGGGYYNTASGEAATVPGGSMNTASGLYSFAAGLRARAIHDGAFVWSGRSNTDFFSTAVDQFLVLAAGGTTIYSNSGQTAGVTLAAGGGSWSSVSDKNLKENFADIDKEALLEKLSAIPVTTWNYKSQDSSIRHIGPMGQDFHAAFGVGETDTRLSTIDADGVALAAIQGLYEIVREKDCEINELKSKAAVVEALEAKVAALEALVNKLAAQNGGGR